MSGIIPEPHQSDIQVNTIEDLDRLIERANSAQKEFSTFSQEAVDKIFMEASKAAAAARIPLAKMAAQETGMGLVEDKVIKNHFAAEMIFNAYKHSKTCGIIERDVSAGIIKIAEPVGTIAGITPTTNPTATAIFKSLLSLKTRNAIVFCPHPRAKAATAAACRVVHEAAVAAGAPRGVVACIASPTVELSKGLMHHKGVHFILATGGPAMVKAAYSSGKPAAGVGAGNTPVIIDESADLVMAVNSVLVSKTFDNGVICASEQSIVCVDSVAEKVRKEFIDRGAYFCTKEQAELLGKTIIKNGALNAGIVGQPAHKIAELAGFEVPEHTKVLIGDAEAVGPEEPFSYEKLSPVLGFYTVPDFTTALDKAEQLIRFGGSGHTACLYTEPSRTDRVEAFGSKMVAGRILINQPASQGAIGDIYNFRLEPSLTLGCGTWGGNSVSENVTIKQLMNVKTVTERRENMLWYRVPPKIYFKRNSTEVALKELAGKQRALIITDKALHELGYSERVEKMLMDLNIDCEVFSDVKPDPDTETVFKGLARCKSFKPDVFIALGGGSPIDAGKIMWLLYEHPELRFEDLALRFMDIRKRIISFPTEHKSMFIAIPTTSGTGSEVTPFSVITDTETKIKYPLADYAIVPDMAIIDSDWVMTMPKSLAAFSGYDSLTHALEAYVATTSSPYTDSLAIQASKGVFANLTESVNEGTPKAREAMHNSATMAGMAFANAFLGICHSLAHKLGSNYNIPHGLANAILLPHVMSFNATDAPQKMAIFSQYQYPKALERYASMADCLGVSGSNNAEKTENLIKACEDLRDSVKIPATIKDAGVTEEAFMAGIDNLAEQAFDDQCTGTNPRYPLIGDLKKILLDAFHGTRQPVRG
ncbi:hypothetical protein P9112_002327 [Eukaryota sp. TZLM1-RC]